MKTFVFRLAQVLAIREREAQGRAAELAAARVELSGLDARIADAENALVAGGVGPGERSAGEFALLGAYHAGLRARLAALRAGRPELEAAVAAAEAVYREARAAAESLVRLRSVREQEHAAMVDREEAKALDEFATLRGRGRPNR